jgi:AcrR family transcriptional regulator
MPRVVDHEQRRREVAAAFGRVVARDGLDAASVRAVAAEAGWSTGVLAHYFVDKDELLVAALRLAIERALERARPHLRRGGRAGLAGALLEAMPLDDERRAEVRLWFTLVGRAVTRPELAAELAAHYAAWRAAPEAFGVPRAAAARLVAAVDGISVQALLDPAAWPPHRQREAVRALLDDVTGVA